MQSSANVRHQFSGANTMNYIFFANEGDIAELGDWCEAQGSFEIVNQTPRILLLRPRVAEQHHPGRLWERLQKQVANQLGDPSQDDLNPANITLSSNADQMGCLANSSLTWWSEKGARQRSAASRSQIDDTDWNKVDSAISAIKSRIRGQSPALVRHYPIMAGAYADLTREGKQLWLWGEKCGPDSSLLKVRKH